MTECFAADAVEVSIGDVIDVSVKLFEDVPGVSSTVTIKDDGGAVDSTCDAEINGIDAGPDGCVYDAPATPAELTLVTPTAFTVPKGEKWTVEFQVVIQ